MDLQGNSDSAIYFFADLTVGTSQPSLAVTIYVRDDLARLKASLENKPPDCVVGADRDNQLTAFLLGLYQAYTVDPIPGGMCFVGSYRFQGPQAREF